jgi:hypothetical protein
MNRRSTLMLISMTLLAFAIASFPQVAFAQSSPVIGTWKLNLDKSKYSPGPPPRSGTLTYTQDGQNIKNTFEGMDAQGNVLSGVLMHIYDGQPHPSSGSQVIDASAYTRLDPNNYIFTRLKAGKLVAVGTVIVSQDGKTLTVTTTGSDANGGPSNSISVHDKQ